VGSRRREAITYLVDEALEDCDGGEQQSVQSEDDVVQLDWDASTVLGFILALNDRRPVQRQIVDAVAEETQNIVVLVV